MRSMPLTARGITSSGRTPPLSCGARWDYENIAEPPAAADAGSPPCGVLCVTGPAWLRCTFGCHGRKMFKGYSKWIIGLGAVVTALAIGCLLFLLNRERQ